MRTLQIKSVLVIMIITLLIATGALAQGWRNPSGGHNHDQRQSGNERVTAAASLEPVGAVDGWGRIMVSDTLLEESTARQLTIHLFGLAVDAQYEVSIDGVFISSLTTDAEGDAWLQFGTLHDGVPEVPADLPPAIDLMFASVVDTSMAVTLEGDFYIMSHGGHGSNSYVHNERVSLYGDDASAQGIARVLRDADDVQTFETRVCGLITGTTYQVMVDGILAGIVTADAVGQAELELSTDGEGDALPTNLQPIEDLRVVEWIDESGTLFLGGTFTGESNSGGHGGMGGNGDCDGTGDCDGNGGGHDDEDDEDDDGMGGNGDGGCGGHGGGRP